MNSGVPHSARSLGDRGAGRPALGAVEGDSTAARVQAALDAGDATTASKELDRLLALAPSHPSLPAMAARLEGLLTARVERASEDLTRAYEARLRAQEREARERQARERESSARVKRAALPPRPRPATPPAPVAPPAAPVVERPLAREDQEPLVRRAVKELEQALEERDVRKLRSLTTDLSPADEKAIASSAWRGIRVAVLGVDVQDGHATAQVLWSLRTQEGTVSTVRRTLSLERSVSGWKIAAIGR